MGHVLLQKRTTSIPTSNTSNTMMMTSPYVAVWYITPYVPSPNWIVCEYGNVCSMIAPYHMYRQVCNTLSLFIHHLVNKSFTMYLFPVHR